MALPDAALPGRAVGPPGHDGSQRRGVQPDGERLASAGGDGTVKIWNSTDGKLIQTFPRTPMRSSASRSTPTASTWPRRRGPKVKVWDLTTRPGSVHRPVRRRSLCWDGIRRGVQPRRPATGRGGEDGVVRSGTGRGRNSYRLARDSMKPCDQRGVQSRRPAAGDGKLGGSAEDWERRNRPARSAPSPHIPIPSAPWRSARTADGWPRPASTGP